VNFSRHSVSPSSLRRPASPLTSLFACPLCPESPAEPGTFGRLPSRSITHTLPGLRRPIVFPFLPQLADIWPTHETPQLQPLHTPTAKSLYTPRWAASPIVTPDFPLASTTQISATPIGSCIYGPSGSVIPVEPRTLRLQAPSARRILPSSSHYSPHYSPLPTRATRGIFSYSPLFTVHYSLEAIS
jgi:hypothetical protein